MIKVVMEAKDIPMGSWVTKRGDNLRWKLMNEVKVVADSETFTNTRQQDCLFLMTTELSSLEAIVPTTELEWIINWEDDYDKLKDIIEKGQLIT